MSNFDKLHHICVVVADIDKSQAWYESIGIGPWQSYPPMTGYTDIAVPNLDAFFKLKYRVCNLPNFQLQLCEPSEDPSPQRTFLDTKGEGVFHVGFEVADANSAEVASKALGLSTMSRGRRDDGTGFNYYDTAQKGGVVLLTRSTPQGK
ncbi:VOC family protein [Mesorhizobium silamurunense]|uniref:VOC family protein n=1 Tax=Mesorhizobium silamurunense TaxID=499528 RepID=UPI00177C7A2B|nr:VOC family protein [Mesorhizobium silamurunense]